jgi:hypothetical protein
VGLVRKLPLFDQRGNDLFGGQVKEICGKEESAVARVFLDVGLSYEGVPVLGALACALYAWECMCVQADFERIPTTAPHHHHYTSTNKKTTPTAFQNKPHRRHSGDLLSFGYTKLY